MDFDLCFWDIKGAFLHLIKESDAFWCGACDFCIARFKTNREERVGSARSFFAEILSLKLQDLVKSEVREHVLRAYNAIA